MSSNQFQVGDRVMLIPFQHKGKVATVRYFGPIGKKFGTWVGLELDEPTGDNNGEVNGEFLFECQENHGLILRNTQVRMYDPDNPAAGVKKSVPSLKDGFAKMNIATDVPVNKDTGLPDSPLITPKDEEHEDGTRAVQNQLLHRSSVENPAPSGIGGASKIGGDKAAKSGWKDRLEKLRQKKQEEKQKQKEEEAKKDPEAEKIRNAFAPSSGISKDPETGKLLIQQDQVTNKLDAEQILKESAEKAEAAANASPTRKPAGLHQRRSSMLQKPGFSNSGPSATSAATDKRNELEAKKQQLAAQREKRQSISGMAKVTPRQSLVQRQAAAKPAPTTTTQSRTGVTTPRQTRPGMTGTRSTLTRTSTAASGVSKTNEAAQPSGTRSSYLTRKPTMTTQGTTGTRTSSNLRNAREGSSSRLGAPSGSQTARGASNSRLGVPSGTAATRGASNSRLGGPSGSATARGASNSRLGVPAARTTAGASPLKRTATGGVSPAKSRLNASPTKRTGTVRPGATATTSTRTPATQRGVAAKTTPATRAAPGTAAKSSTAATARANVAARNAAGGQIPLEYKKMEATLREKIAEVEVLNSTVAELKEKIEAMEEKHKQEMEDANAIFQQNSDNANQKLIEEKMYEQEQSLKKLEIAYQERDEAVAKVTALEEAVQQLQEQMQQKEADFATALTEKEQALENANNQAVLEQVEAAKKELEQKLEEREKALVEEVEKSAKLQQSLNDETERRKEEQEIAQLELDAIKDEKQELIDKFMEQSKVEEEDPLKDLSLEEIKIQNKKLRQAISSLTWGFEEEKKKLEEKMQDETDKDKIIAEQDERLKEMDFLLDEVDRKENERAEMEAKLEEIVEYEAMVEEMVAEIAKKEEEAEEMAERMVEMEEEQALVEELNENLEQYNKELIEESNGKDKEISDMRNEIDQLEGIILDQDSAEDKYKDIKTGLENQVKALTEQLQATVSESDSKDQITVLLEKQQQLIAELREADKKQLAMARNTIEFWQGKTKSYVVESILPESLVEDTLLDAFDKIQVLFKTNHKALLLIREICEVQIQKSTNVYDDVQEHKQYLQVLLQVGLLCHRFVDIASELKLYVSNMTPGQYKEVVKMLLWDKLNLLQEEIDKISDLLKDQNLAYNFELNTMAEQVQEAEKLLGRVQNMFVLPSPEDLIAQEVEGGLNTVSIENQRRANLAEKCSKLSVRSGALRLAIAVSFVIRLSEQDGNKSDEREAVYSKMTLIYWRLLEIVLKIDHIGNFDSGDDFLDLQTLNTDLRLTQKYDSIKVLWEGSESEKQMAQQKSWISILEAAERDITTLNNDYKFKKLADIVDKKYGSTKFDYNNFYTVDYQGSGPWLTLTGQVRDDLQDMATLKTKNQQLVEKQKQQNIQILTLKREKDESNIIKEQLDNKLGIALAKAEQVPALEIEKKENLAKVKRLANQLEKANEDIAAYKEKEKDLKKKLEEAKKVQPVAAPEQQQQSVATPSHKSSIRARQTTTKHSSRSSRTSNFFANLQMSGFNKKEDYGMPGHSRQNSMQNNNDYILSQMQITEDVFISIINELQGDRMRLKGREMQERLFRLEKENSAFSQLIEKHRGILRTAGKHVPIKLNEQERAVVENALAGVENLKTNYKRQMAKARIIDFSKLSADKDAAPSAASEVAKKRNENVNFMVTEARRKMTDAMEILFTKDSNLRKMVTAKQSTRSEADPEAQEKEKAADLATSSQFKVGTLRLRGKVQIPERKVVIEDQNLLDLRRNLALFVK